MKKNFTRLSALVLALILALSVLGGCAKTEKTTATIADIAKHGNLILDITGAALFDKGYEYGDVLEVTLGDQTWEMPLCSNYSDVDTGAYVLRASSAEDAVFACAEAWRVIYWCQQNKRRWLYEKVGLSSPFLDGTCDFQFGRSGGLGG